MKKIILGRIGSGQTVQFAFDELVRCLKAMDEKLFLDRRVYDARKNEKEDVLWIGLDGSIPYSIDDEIKIDIREGSGVITGSNERAVLLAVYRALFELGCRWVRPGKNGELLPKKSLDIGNMNIQVQEKASYRHRAVCLEGANDYQHVADMIDWLPKIGMNGYFVQYKVPFTFFDRWYSHSSNPNISGYQLSQEDVIHMWSLLEEEIFKRSLMYHAVGHGWTCEPFGIEGSSWSISEKKIDPEVKKYFAELNGQREIWRNPLNTNLCYSNPEVRDIMTNAIVQYCKENPKVDYLHFWLADDINNHCECPECRKQLPSDFYVKTLNELDEKLTLAGVSTKIVFLIYVDLLWAPEVEKIRNQDRFVLMFAPITRTYTKAFTEDCRILPDDELAPYVRNKLIMPKSVSENITRLSKWQENFEGDSFDFDYHLMWDHQKDPGYYECARILHKDMTNLDKIGLNGMVSCQNQRVFLPTGLPMYAMAKGLWDKESRFEDVVKEYFTAAFGEDGEAVAEYLKTLSTLFHPPYIRNELSGTEEFLVNDFAKIREIVEAFRTKYIEPWMGTDASWNYLSYHANMCLLLGDVLKLRTLGEKEASIAKAKEFLQYLNEIETETHPVFDTQNSFKKKIYGQYLEE